MILPALEMEFVIIILVYVIVILDTMEKIVKVKNKTFFLNLCTCIQFFCQITKKNQKFFVWIQIVHITENVIQQMGNVFAILDIVEKIVKVKKNWNFLKIDRYLNSKYIFVKLLQNSEILCSDPNCSNNGKCDTTEGKCICDSGYSGERCKGRE